MKDIKILDLNTLDLKTALLDETIFVLHERRQRRVNHPDEEELRCSCVSLKTMPSEMMRDMCKNIDEYKVIKIEL